MKEIKVKPLKVFDLPKGVFDNPEQPGSSKDKFAKEVYQPSRYHVAVMPFGDGKATYALPFQVAQNVAIAICPNPVLLYLDLAAKAIGRSERIMQELETVDESLFLALSEKLNGLIQEKTLAVILLHTSLEAFVNMIIPDNASYAKTRDKQEVLLSKVELEKVGFDEKFKKVIKSTTGFDFFNSNQKMYDRILAFTKLRNDLVHLKTVSDKTNSHYFSVFNELLHCDLEFYFDSVVNYMNAMDEGLVEFT